MLEKVKSILLGGLVIASGVLSSALWNSTPSYEALDVSNATSHPVLGPSQSVGEVLVPERILVHFTENDHRILGPFTSKYQQLMILLHRTNVGRLTLVGQDNPIMTQSEQGQGQSIEYQYGAPLDGKEAQSLFAQVNWPYPSYSIKAVRIVSTKDEGWKILLLAPDGGQSYVADVQFTQDSSVKQVMAQLQGEPRYTRIRSNFGDSYIAQGSLTVSMPTFERKSLRPETLAQSFFVDPTITRRILERDGSLIITDGNRGVQIQAQSKRIFFDNPSVDRSKAVTSNEQTLQKAIDFINDHGGLQGQYVVSENSSYGHSRTFVMHQYYNGLPLLDANFSVQIRMVGYDTVEMNRSWVYLGPFLRGTQVQVLPVGPLLSQVEDPTDRRQSQTTAYLAYAPESSKLGEVTLHPVWVVEKTGTLPIVFDAITGGKWKDTGGWLNGLE